jgi:hypothetical protein
MSRLLLIPLLLALCWGGGFALGKQYRERQVAVHGLSARPRALIERPIAVIVSAKESGPFIERVIRSILSQRYPNFRLFYVDDASTDGSFALAQELLSSAHERPIALVQNRSPLGLSANLLRVVETCDDGEIIVLLRGEEELAHEWALQEINNAYADPEVWMTYGAALRFPDYAPILPSTSPLALRSPTPRAFPPPLTFYARLFKQIAPADLTFAGEYADSDAPFLLPLFEMARSHAAPLSSVAALCHAPAPAPIAGLLEHLALQTPYTPLERLFPAGEAQ